MSDKKKPGRPKGSTRVNPETALEKRATFIVRKDLLGKIELLVKAESYRLTLVNKQVTNVKLKDVVNDALDEYVTGYEEKHGEL